MTVGGCVRGGGLAPLEQAGTAWGRAPVRREMLGAGLAWPAGKVVPPLRGTTAHLWAVRLDVSRQRLESLAATLSPDERERSARFHRADLSQRFVAARGMLRELLGQYLGVGPTAVRFVSAASGKPSVAPDLLATPLQFNVSHSNELALYAMSSVAHVGIDVEDVVALADLDAVAAGHFSHAERADLARVPVGDRVRAFYRCWTRKEAYLKARGTGLLTPLDSFDVSLTAHEPAVLRRDESDPDAPRRWSLTHLEPSDTAVGALAIEASVTELHCRRWAG